MCALCVVQVRAAAEQDKEATLLAGLRASTEAAALELSQARTCGSNP